MLHDKELKESENCTMSGLSRSAVTCTSILSSATGNMKRRNSSWTSHRDGRRALRHRLTRVVGLIRGQEGQHRRLASRYRCPPIQDDKDVPIVPKPRRCPRLQAMMPIPPSPWASPGISVERRDQFRGNIVALPTRRRISGGAQRMVQEGCMENPKVDYASSASMSGAMDVGNVEVKFNKLNASTDGIKITVQGKAGHGALS